MSAFGGKADTPAAGPYVERRKVGLNDLSLHRGEAARGSLFFGSRPVPVS